jgi:hypothetical protein
MASLHTTSAEEFGALPHQLAELLRNRRNRIVGVIASHWWGLLFVAGFVGYATWTPSVGTALRSASLGLVWVGTIFFWGGKLARRTYTGVDLLRRHEAGFFARNRDATIAIGSAAIGAATAGLSTWWFGRC